MIPDLSIISEPRRAWLNGFVTGFLGIEPTLVSDEALAAAGLTTDTVIVPPQPSEEEFPWHQPELSLNQRIAMADGKPLNRKLMAAMAQLDCGSCGYDCKRYSEAIALGEESDLSLCSPGGKETKQMIKSLLKENGGVKAAAKTTSKIVKPDGDSRQNPFPATLLQSLRLNAKQSSKDTRDVRIDLRGSNLQYKVGDALGVWPTNCPQLVIEILRHLDGDHKQSVTMPSGERKPIMLALAEDFCLKDPTDELLEMLSQRTENSEAKRRLASLVSEGVEDGFDVLDALQVAPDVRLSGDELIETLENIKPRLYSIASSMKAVGKAVHLTVGKVSYQRDDRIRKGVASTMFAERLEPGQKVRVFVHPNRTGFTTPKDGSKPMIMIGPGTGIAPFVAFLQEREATNATGKNWLFFGDQHQATDFLYEQQLEQWSESGLLTRLSTAFSRDGDEKVYVQNRMQEQAAELWQWINEGAFIFVCGDKSRMAADVDRALVDICQAQGKTSPNEARKFVEKLGESKRYVRDVY